MRDYIFSYFIFIYSKIISIFLSRYFVVELDLPSKFSNFKLLKVIKQQTHDDESGVALYQTDSHEKYIVKSVSYNIKNSAYHRLKKEAFVLDLISNLAKKYKKQQLLMFPRIKSLQEASHRVLLVEEYLSGKELRKSSNIVKRKILANSIISLQDFSSDEIVDKLKFDIGRRSKLYILLSFPIFFISVTLRDIHHLIPYIKLMISFYVYYLSENIFDPRYVVAHRDIHTQNILVSKNGYHLLDPEVITTAERLTDIAITAKSVCSELGSEYKNLLHEILHTNSDKKKFMALSIYYSLQIMAIRKRNDPDYQQGYVYLNSYFYQTKELLMLKKQSLAQYFIRFILDCISLGIRLFNVKKIIRDSSILCYHSVGFDNWNFTIHPKSLEEQLLWIKSQAKFISLDSIVKNKKELNHPGIAITFDDGYKNILKHAEPIINKLKIKPTLFILGNPAKANRKELDNKNALLSDSEIKLLQDKSWDIGYHTNTHPDLRNLSEEEIKYESIISKSSLEQRLGLKIRYFAYPRGIYNKKIDKIIKDSNYTAAFTVDGGSYRTSKDKKHINRVCFEGDLESYQFQALMSPIGLSFYAFFMKSLKVKEGMLKFFSALIKNSKVNYSLR